MRGHTPHRIALTHISHHDQPQRLSGRNSSAACLPYHLVAEHTSAQYCIHTVGSPVDTYTHTHTRRILHPAHLLQAPDERNQPWAGPLPLLHAQWLLKTVPAPLHCPRGTTPSPAACVIVPCGYVYATRHLNPVDGLVGLSATSIATLDDSEAVGTRSGALACAVPVAGSHCFCMKD